MTAVREADWFRRFPNGGTTHLDPAGPPARPNGGGTAYVRNSGNPYANVEDQQAQDIVTVELPEMEEEE